MRVLNPILLMLSISLNILLISTTFVMYSNFNRRMVFNMDQIRHQYENDIRTYYMSACIYGTDYPEEYRNVIGFNVNSPPIYCKKQLTYIEDSIYNSLYRLGK